MIGEQKTLARIPRSTCQIAGVLTFLIGSSAAMAQLPTATILGTVKDSTGAVVPEATVTVRNLETGLTRTDKSRADGSYRLVALPVGTYDVRAAQTGFRAEVRSGVTLTIGQEAVLNFALQVGAIEQTVEVTAEAPLVNTTSGSLGTLVNEKQVADLPLNGRNYVELTLLQPGVAKHRAFRVSPMGSGTWFSVNGAPPRSNFYMLDGAPMAHAWGATSASVADATLGIEGIREWRVVTNSFSAEYGMRMGSQMTIVTKGGTNSFHGSLFEYLRNSALDARNFFDYKTEVSARRLPAFTRNQFGGSVGGPIKRDRAFFFATYEALRERVGLSIVSNVIPREAKLDGGLVPQIAPVVKPILALFPDPNLPGNRYTFPATRVTNEHYGQARGDYIFSPNDMAFVRYAGDGAEKTEPYNYPRTTQVFESRLHFATLSETHTFSPALLGTFRLSFSQTSVLGDDRSDLIGPWISYIPGQIHGMTSIGGVTYLGSNTRTPSWNRQSVYSLSGDLFHSKGRHSIKLGTLINRYRVFVLNANTTEGADSFAIIRVFLVGRPTSFAGSTPGSIWDRTYKFNTWGFYLQDDFRVLAKLTLNLGLRYEFHTDFNEANGHGSSLRDTIRDAEFTVGLPFENPSLRNLSPRFGFAWDVRGDGKTAVRGGFGMLYDIGSFGGSLLVASAASPPFSSISQLREPASLTSFTVPLTFPPEAVGRTPRTLDYHIQNPHMLHYNLTVERELPFNMGVTLAYAGSRGFNLLRSPEGNPNLPQILRDGRQFWAGTEPPRNPNWAALNYHTADGNSWYNSFQFVVNKRLSKGLQFQSAYTWSKTMDEKTGVSGDDSGGSPQSFPFTFRRENERAISDYHLAHTWRFNAIYRIPERTGLGALGGKMLNGWWMSGILTTQTGAPFTPTLSSNRSRSRGANDRPDLNPGRKNENIILGGPDLYFDPLAFSIQPTGFLGTAGRNILIAPGLANLDLSLAKDTSLGFLGESGKLEFRAEFFNILNRANFGRPNQDVYAGRADLEPPLATAGQVTYTLTTSRQIQLALKLIW